MGGQFHVARDVASPRKVIAFYQCRRAAGNAARGVPGVVLEAAVASGFERREAVVREGRLVVLEDREAVRARGVEHDEVVEDLRIPRAGAVRFDNLRKMVEIGKKYGVYMYHENEKDIYGDIAQRVLKIMQNVDGLKYIYDPANYLQCGEPADKTLALFHKTTDYFHIKDVISATGALVPAGCGDGNIAKLLDMISDDKVLTLEPHLALFDAYKSIDNTEMKHQYIYADPNEAFDAAVAALKKVLNEVGYREVDGVYVK